jgi:hypothetical protein
LRVSTASVSVLQIGDVAVFGFTSSIWAGVSVKCRRLSAKSSSVREKKLKLIASGPVFACPTVSRQNLNRA